MEFMIGADPELFMKKDNTPVSAYNAVPGTKEQPHPVKNGAVQVDGMALEFNINPASSEEEFVYSINSVMGQLKEMVPDFEVVAEPVAHFGHEYIASQPEKAVELGCDPDFNAWEEGRVNEPPNVKAPFRTGAGHIHIGWTEGADKTEAIHMETCLTLVKQLDFFLALPSLFFDDGDGEQRRELYGKAGCFRPKSYGVEYRVLSNRWLENENLQRWVYRATMKAIDCLCNGRRLEKKWGDIQEIINTSDKEKALVIIEEEGLEVPYAS